MDVTAPKPDRLRAFCGFCGAMTDRPTYVDGKPRCHAHSGYPSEASLIPPDPATTLPSMARELDAQVPDLTPAREKGA